MTLQKTYICMGIILGLCLGISSNALATHIRAGDLTIRRLNNNSLTYRITVVLYRDITGVPAGDGLIDFGDGTDNELVSSRSLGRTEDQLTEILLYQVDHIFASAGTYKISYFEKNRNPTVRNIEAPSDTPFFIESEFLINPALGLNSSPILLIPPVLQARIGQKYTINAGAYDAEGDSLSYRLTICKQGRDVPVQNYRFPDDPNETWTKEKEDCTQPGEFYIDPATGDLVWDAPNEVGEYNVAFFVDEWREGIRIGSVNRDMQIIVKDVLNLRPILTLPDDICIVAGETLTGTILAEDQIERICATGDRMPTLDLLTLTLINNIPFSTPSNAPNFTITGLQPPVGKEEGIFSWATTCNDIREQPYQFTFQVVDNPRPENPTENAKMQLGDMKTWSVRVVGPPPQNLTAIANESNNTISLNWDDYICGNVNSIEIYRKVGSFDLQMMCETGVPDYAGYEKVGSVEAGVTSFVDTTVEKGANYCYRIYATFALPEGGESMASNEACAFLPATLYMTNVSVTKTDETDGEIEVSWITPSDDTLPSPVTYKLFRAEGLFGKQNVQEISKTFTVAENSYVDKGLNTLRQRYHYWVEIYTGGTLLDSARIASQVSLGASSNLDEIRLEWEAHVPWSITSMDYPEHEVYRKEQGESDDLFTLIGTAQASQFGLQYVDKSTESNPLIFGQNYTYKVLTRGTYEYDPLPAPLENFSQELTTSLLDTIPPCPPILTLARTACESLVANEIDPKDDCIQNYSNNLTWEDATDAECENDIIAYYVYYSEQIAEEKADFNRIDTVLVRNYEHINLPSLAGSYAVTAVDESGNESALSNIESQDNECTYFELPTAFTPNEDGINDTLIPFRCPRFVKSVTFEVFNRWGESVFKTDSNINIEWDGRDKNGELVSPGTYYYNAEVIFYRLNPEDASESFTGWIQVIR
ncbi:gliding motility-associated C-terminal domain-containing protein [Algivirga pacifica]|uniref:Gliding motility-associated C-terminal domain-containing protein n=1 Tax=Algivirga pacifica TaxID=1162670 RepID=A0ABP9DKP0_9BACT